jgi:MFS transporter, AAHS family, 4-hydroxybenzoate transporter
VDRAYDIETLVDEQKLGLFNLNLLLWSFLAMLADGYEISAMSFAGPELVRSWGIAAGSLGPVFSASLFGIFVGAPLLGYVGDRFGRKTAIVTGCLVFGVSTLGMVAATSLPQMFVLRLLAGIGIGGLMPNTVSLTSELSPKRHRATLIVLMFTGITVGGSIPSVISAWLVPDLGWPVLFWIGGLAPMVIAACLVFALPESIKFLAQRAAGNGGVLQLARKLRPELSLPDSARFSIRAPVPAQGSGLRQICGVGFEWITPLLWFCFAATLMANYFLNSWMPVLFEQTGLSPEQAALASGLYHIGGTVGGLLISFLLDRYGFVAVALFLAVAGPAVAVIGLHGWPFATLVAMSTMAGICVLGAQFGNNAAGGMLYPTEFRAKALGWAFSAGRLGSVLGPLLGGILIAQQWSLTGLFGFAAAPLVAGAIAATVLARLCYRRFGAMTIDDRITHAISRESEWNT